jgi:hypothetical protein
MPTDRVRKALARASRSRWIALEDAKAMALRWAKHAGSREPERTARYSLPLVDLVPTNGAWGIRGGFLCRQDGLFYCEWLVMQFDQETAASKRAPEHFCTVCGSATKRLHYVHWRDYPRHEVNPTRYRVTGDRRGSKFIPSCRRCAGKLLSMKQTTAKILENAQLIKEICNELSRKTRKSSDQDNRPASAILG